MRTVKSRPARLELSSTLVSLFLVLSLVPPLAACKEEPKTTSQQQTATGAPAAGQTASSPDLAAKIEALPDLPKVLPVAPLQDITAGKPTYLPAETIEGWKKADDRAAMKEHAWRLFASLMRPMYRDDSYSPLDHNAVVRAYDTWHSIDEAVPEKGGEIVDFSQAAAPPQQQCLTEQQNPVGKSHLAPSECAGANQPSRGNDQQTA
jgi:hypothetical protein